MFYFILGFSTEADKFFLFFAFVFLGLCSFTFLGQMMVSLFRDSETAQGFGALIVSFSSLFSGILIRPGESFFFYLYSASCLSVNLTKARTAVFADVIPVS